MAQTLIKAKMIDFASLASAGIVPIAAFNMLNGKIAESHAGNAVTFALKTRAGNDPSASFPVWVLFGDGQLRAITSALSITVSLGSTLGAVNNVAFRVWIAIVDDAGTLRLAVRQCTGANGVSGFPGHGILSSTAEGGAGGADTAGVTYTGTAVTAKPYAIVAFAEYDSGLAAVGTWTVSPTRIGLFGPGIAQPGDLVRRARTPFGSVATGSTVYTTLAGIPPSNEGTEFMTQAITPQHAANYLDIDAVIACWGFSVAGALCAIALHQDSVTDALASSIKRASVTTASQADDLRVRCGMRANTAISTTFKIRAGSSGAGTFTFNGEGGASRGGGTLASYIEVLEYMG